MAVPGRVPTGAPAGLAEVELFSVDAYVRDFDTTDALKAVPGFSAAVKSS